jgi:hypothetical protein
MMRLGLAGWRQLKARGPEHGRDDFHRSVELLDDDVESSVNSMGHGRVSIACPSVNGKFRSIAAAPR